MMLQRARAHDSGTLRAAERDKSYCGYVPEPLSTCTLVQVTINVAASKRVSLLCLKAVATERQQRLSLVVNPVRDEDTWVHKKVLAGGRSFTNLPSHFSM